MHKIGSAIPDFEYQTEEGTWLEDVKGMISPGSPQWSVFKMKMRLLNATFQRYIMIVKQAGKPKLVKGCSPLAPRLCVKWRSCSFVSASNTPRQNKWLWYPEQSEIEVTPEELAILGLTFTP